MILRKLKTLGLIVARCKNWLEIIAIKLRISCKDRDRVAMRNRLILEVQGSFWTNWRQFFEAAIADVYNVTDSRTEIFLDIDANIVAFICLTARLRPNAKVFSQKWTIQCCLLQ